MKKVTICGFGNVGKSLVHKLYKKFEINIFSLSNTLKENEIITSFKGKRDISIVNRILRDPRELEDTDLLIITVPNFLREKLIRKIVEHLNKKTIICFIPGIGPSQFISNKYLKEFKVLCLERVPYICRTNKNFVIITGDREKIKYSTLSSKDDFKELLEVIFEKEVEKIKYHNVTLTSSNAVLHTTRLFSIFNENIKKSFEKKILFYKEWDDKASIEFKKCDDEIVNIYEKLYEYGILKDKVDISLMKYYEASNIQQLTNKITSIEAFSKIELDMIEKEKKYFLKESSRFLTEDIPFGLLMFKGISEILHLNVPNIDKIILWAQKILKVEYINEKGKIINYTSTGCPQNFGCFTLNDLKEVFNYE